MRIAVYGAGGVGGYFGARLIQSGHDVALIARGKHLNALRTTGLRLTSPLGNAHLPDLMATDDPTEVGPVDAVLLCIKTWQLDSVLADVTPMVGPTTFFVPLLNGVEAAPRTAAVLGEARVLDGTCKIMSRVGAPGEIEHLGATPWVAFGERSPTRPPTDRVQHLAAALRSANIAVATPDDIEAVVWEKLIFVASVGGVGAVTRAPVGVMREIPQTRRMLQTAMEEVQAVAVARGVRVTPTAAKDALGFVDGLPAHGTSSLQRDIAEGRRTELDAWCGAVVRLGEAAGVDTPVHGQLYASLLPQELRARGEHDFP